MKKTNKLLILTIVFALCTLCLFTSSFAAENGLQKAGDEVRNVVGGAENVVEDAGKSAANGIRGGLNAAGDATNNAMEGIKNGAEDTKNMTRNGVEGTRNTITSTTTDMTDNGYNATRTATGTGFAGANNVWMWFILAVIALAIIGLVWYYAAQNNQRNHID